MSKTWKEEMMTCLKGRGIKYYQMYQVEGKYQFDRDHVLDVGGNEIKYLTQITSSNSLKSTINFSIIEKDFNRVFGKATATIELESKTDKESLILISNKIREDLFRNAERIYIFYNLKGMIVGNGSWALSHFEKEELKVSINGLSLEQENLLLEGLKNEVRKVSGMWIDETPYACSSLTLLIEGIEVTLETNYFDGSKSSERLKSTQLDFGIRYDKIKRKDHGEYFIVEENGTLKYYSEDVMFKKLEPYKLK